MYLKLKDMTTLEDIKRIISEEIEKLNKIGFYPVEIRRVSLVNSVSFYADANRIKGEIRVSSYYLDAPEIEIRATLMHELCHMVPESGNGHGKEWKSIADKVSRSYPQYSITRVGTNVAGKTESYNLRVASAVSTASHGARPLKVIQCKCNKCGRIVERHRESRFTLHPDAYRCGYCGGDFTRL